MKTLIRVRGKRGNLKRKMEELTEQRKEARQDVSKRQKVKAESLSYLENLPIEMLQRIFIESRNPELVHVSKRLKTQLLSSYTTLQLTIGCFTDVRVENAPEEEWGDEDFAAVQRLRLLISQSWFNFPLFQAARYQWLLDTSAIEIRNLLCSGGASLSSDDMRDIEQRLSAMFKWLLQERTATTSLIYDQRRLLSPREADDGALDEDGEPPKEDGEGICYFERDDRAAWITIVKSSHVSPRPSQDPPHTDFNEICIRCPGTRTILRYRFLDAIKSTKHIPPTVLRQPFTQSQADLLVNLLTTTFSEEFDPEGMPATRRSSPVPIDDELKKAWESGLLYALESGSCPAISTLIDLPMSDLGLSLWGRHQSKSPRPGPGSELLVTEPLKIWSNPEHPYHRLPWAWCRRNTTQYSYPRVAFTAKQALCCIKKIPEDPDLYLRIINHASQAHFMIGNSLVAVKDRNYFPYPSTEILNGLFMEEKRPENIKHRHEIGRLYKLALKIESSYKSVQNGSRS